MKEKTNSELMESYQKEGKAISGKGNKSEGKKSNQMERNQKEIKYTRRKGYQAERVSEETFY